MLERNTLKYFESLPQFRPIYWGSATTESIRKTGLATVDESSQDILPTPLAFEFYLLNHIVSDLKTKYAPLEYFDPVDEIIFNTYAQMVSDYGTILVKYLLLICIREARHERGHKLKTVNITADTPILNFEVFNTLCELLYTSGSNSHTVIKNFILKDGIKLTDLATFLEVVFTKGDFQKHYGGKAWGKIAGALRMFIHGEISLEMLVDTSFTLAHNTSAIFNKGYYFRNDMSLLLKVLDLQRAGELINAFNEYHNAKTDDFGIMVSTNSSIFPISERLTFFKNAVFRHAMVFPDASSNKINWQKVIDLGAVGNYAKELAKPPAPVVPASNGGNVAAVGNIFNPKGADINIGDLNWNTGFSGKDFANGMAAKAIKSPHAKTPLNPIVVIGSVKYYQAEGKVFSTGLKNEHFMILNSESDDLQHTNDALAVADYLADIF